MSAYMFVLTKVLKTEGWEPYQSQVGQCIAAHGGEYVIKRSPVKALEGNFNHDRLTLFRFPSIDAIQAFWDSDDYVRIRAMREGLGILDVWAIPGCELEL